MIERRFALTGFVLGASFFLASVLPATAADQSENSVVRIRVTPDNFVSLNFQVDGENSSNLSIEGSNLIQSVDQPSGNAFGSTTFGRSPALGAPTGGSDANTGSGSGLSSGSGLMWPGTPTSTGSGGGNVETQSAPLSQNQLRELFTILADLQIASGTPTATLGGTNTATETLILVVSDEKNRDQRYTIQNRGKPRLRWYANLREYLERMRSQKFTSGLSNTSRPGNPATSAGINLNSFVSVTYETVGGFAGLSTSTKIVAYSPPTDFFAASLDWNQKVGKNSARRSAALNMAELQELLKILNAARLPAMNGQKYVQEGLADGLNERITLQLADGRVLTVDNYGNKAPASYYDVRKFLNDLIEAKTATGFNPLGTNSPPPEKSNKPGEKAQQ